MSKSITWKRRVWLGIGTLAKWLAIPYITWFEIEYNAVIIGIPKDTMQRQDIEFQGDEEFESLITTDIPPKEEMN